MSHDVEKSQESFVRPTAQREGNFCGHEVAEGLGVLRHQSDELNAVKNLWFLLLWVERRASVSVFSFLGSWDEEHPRCRSLGGRKKFAKVASIRFRMDFLRESNYRVAGL